MFLLLKNGDVYTPDYIGRKDILIFNNHILKIDEHINFDCPGFEVKIIDASNDKVVPGFIDQHVHFIGGGGEGGPITRTPEIMLSDLTTAGITTAVGLLGTDGITRNMASLLAKARALEEEGITTYIYTGCYSLPTKTLTGSVQSDLVLIDKVIGSGEIAMSDHRSSQPNVDDLKKLAAETRVGGILANKCGIVHLHVGDGQSGLLPLMEIVKNTELPIKQFMPTHINRIEHLLRQSIDFIQLGGHVDLTSGIYFTESNPECCSISDALKIYIKNGIPLDTVCASSDSNGSLPVFDQEGNLISITAASASVLFKDIKAAVDSSIVSLEQALKLITINPAKALRLYPKKGTITERSDADFVLLDKDLKIQTVIAKGRVLVEDGKPMIKGFFET